MILADLSVGQRVVWGLRNIVAEVVVVDLDHSITNYRGRALVRNISHQVGWTGSEFGLTPANHPELIGVRSLLWVHPTNISSVEEADFFEIDA